MDKKVLRLTQGALMTAIFGVLVFLNRQTAGFAEQILVYVYPLPIAIYCARYGFKAGSPALAAMMLLSFLIGSLTYAFYAATSLVTGFICGGCIHRGFSARRTMFFMMIVGIIVNLVDLLVMTALTGISLEAEIAEAQGMLGQFEEQMVGMFAASGQEETVRATFDLYSDVSFVKRMLIIGMMLIGVLQAFLIYVLGTMIMRRMKIKVPKFSLLKGTALPKWAGYVIGGLYFGSQIAVRLIAAKQPGEVKTFMDLGTLGIILFAVYAFTRVFLIIAGLRPTAGFFMRLSRSKGLAVVLTVLLLFMFSTLPLCVGLLSLTGLLGKLTARRENTEENGSGNSRAADGRTLTDNAGSADGRTLTGNARPMLADPGKTDYLMLVNPWRALPEGYDERIEPELETYHSPYTGSDIRLEKRTMQAVRDMMEAMEEDGITIDLCDGFRTVKTQEKVMEEMIAKYGEEYARSFVAVPGHSEHHTGLAVDVFLVADGKVISERAVYLKETERWAKVHEYLAAYGFILRYPEGKRDITGIIYEPWHYRFVGEGAAMRMQMTGQTLEEYLGQK